MIQKGNDAMKKLSAIALLSALLLLASLTAVAAPQQDGVGVGEYTIDVDGTFNSENAVKRSIVSVSIEWDTMVFNYDGGSKGTWSTIKHTYEGVVDPKWDVDMFPIRLTNHSNVPINAEFSFAPIGSLTVTGKFYTASGENTYSELTTSTISIASAEGTPLADAPRGSVYFSVSGSGISNDCTIGDIIVTISVQSGS